MAKRKSLKQEIYDEIKDRIGFGRSKFDDKKSDRDYIQSLKDNSDDEIVTIDPKNLKEKKYFYTKSTINEVQAEMTRFVRWVRQRENRRVPIASCENYIDEYLDMKRRDAEFGKISMKTVKKERTQLCKFYRLNGEDYPLPRCSSNSMKGRVLDDPKWVPEEHSEQIKFWSACGVRKGELRYLTLKEVDKLLKKNSNNEEFCKNLKKSANENGQISNLQLVHGRMKNGSEAYFVKTLIAKHGKTNYNIVSKSNEDYLKNIFDNKKFDEYYNPPDHANVHACRRFYAQNLYKEVARNPYDLLPEERYITRDGTNRVFDREALSFVGENLGHGSGRLFDVVHSYLR